MTAAFPDGVSRFFDELDRHNTRSWFMEHRGDYDRLVRQPLETLAAEAAAGYGPAHVMRPNRDVRFSADKAPYKTNGSLWAGEIGGVYLQIDRNAITAGGGMYEPTRDQLSRARATIDEDRQAASSLRSILARLERSGYERAGPDLTTAPRGYPRDHPFIDLLRKKHFAATRSLATDATVDEIVKAWRGVQPLIDWTAEHIGLARSWP